MAINYTRLFTRLGKLIGGWNESRSNASTMRAREATILAQYQTTNQVIVGGIDGVVDLQVNSLSTWDEYLRQLAEDTLIAEVFADRGWQDITLTIAFEELCRQMSDDSESLLTSPSTITITNIGTHTTNSNLPFSWVTSKLDFLGSDNDLIRPDTITAYSNTDREIQLLGLEDASDPIYPNSPGINTFATVLDDNIDSETADPGLDSWTNTSTLANYTSQGTLARVTSTAEGSTYEANLTDTGSTAYIQQSVTLTENTVYCLSYRAEPDTIAAGAGTVKLDIINSDTGSTYKAGPTVSTASLTGAVNAAAVFVGEDIPTNTAIRLTFTAATANDIVNVRQININTMDELSENGIRLLGFGYPVANLEWEIDVANDNSNVHTSLYRGVDRLLDVNNFTKRIPTSGSPSQADALVS